MTVRENREKINSLSQALSSLNSRLDGLENSIGELVQKTESAESGLSTTVDSHLEKIGELRKEITDQLGYVSNEKLANAFQKSVDILDDSVDKWFKWTFYTTIILFISVVGVVIWQVVQEDVFFTFNFLPRLALTSPIIFFLSFVSLQFSHERKLLEEYRFKSAIARSLDAYRLLVEEVVEGLDSGTQSKLDAEAGMISFITSTIKKLYIPPSKLVHNYSRKMKGETVSAKSLFDLVSDTFRQLIDKDQ